MAKQNFEQSSYIISVIGLVLAFFQPLPGLILSVVALSQAKKSKGEMAMKAKRYATLGIIVSAILIMAAIVIALTTPDSLSGLI